MGQADCKQETITARGSTCVVVAYQVVHKSISLFVGRERLPALLSCNPYTVDILDILRSNTRM